VIRKPILIAALIGAAAAALFIALASRNLEAQGLYQDEALQASGAFAYVGGPPIAAVSIRGVPVLNNSYLGAIKTGVYGLYMRITGRPFTIRSWRMTAILAVALGLLLFPLVAWTLPPPALALGLLLLATDASALLMTRHDWGPVAFAMALRLGVVAMLLRDAPDVRSAQRNNFAVGALAGLAVFEKLSSVALLAPVAIALALQPFRRSGRALAALIAGGVIGGLPLIALNGVSLLRSHTLISMSAADARLRPPFRDFFRGYLGEALSAGAGPYARKVVLGDEGAIAEGYREEALAGALLAITAVISVWKLRQRPEFRAAATLAFSVLGIGAVLSALPQRTAVHHHIQAVPFVYFAAAAAWAGLGRLKARRPQEKVAAALLLIAALLLAGNHVYTVTKVESALAAGRAGPYFDRRFNSLGYFAASKRNEAVFLLADWGLASLVRCLAQGDDSLARELYWDYGGPRDLENAARKAGRRIVYLVTPARTGIAPETAARINRDAGLLPGWRETAPEAEAAALQPLILVRKFEVAAR
jgi:hypothetical protein